MIPKPQLFYPFRREKPFARLVANSLFGNTVLKSVQFDREPRDGTVEVEEIFPRWMLAAEFEPGESPRPQCAPKLLFLLRLIATQSPRVCGGVHGAKSRTPVKRNKPSGKRCLLSPTLSSIRWRRGRRDRVRPSDGKNANSAWLDVTRKIIVSWTAFVHAARANCPRYGSIT